MCGLKTHPEPTAQTNEHCIYVVDRIFPKTGKTKGIKRNSPHVRLSISIQVTVTNTESGQSLVEIPHEC